MSKLSPKASLNITQSHVKLASTKIPYAIHGSLILRVYLLCRYYPEMVPFSFKVTRSKNIYILKCLSILSLYYILVDRLKIDVYCLWTIIPLLIIKTYQETSTANQACESSRSFYPPSHVTQYFPNTQSHSNSNTLKKID